MYLYSSTVLYMLLYCVLRNVTHCVVYSVVYLCITPCKSCERVLQVLRYVLVLVCIVVRYICSLSLDRIVIMVVHSSTTVCGLIRRVQFCIVLLRYSVDSTQQYSYMYYCVLFYSSVLLVLISIRWYLQVVVFMCACFYSDSIISYHFTVNHS